MTDKDDTGENDTGKQPHSPSSWAHPPQTGGDRLRHKEGEQGQAHPQYSPQQRNQAAQGDNTDHSDTEPVMRSSSAYDPQYRPPGALARLIVFVIGVGLLVLGLSLAFPLTGSVDPYLVRALLVLFIFGGAAAFWSRSSLLRLAKVAGIWALIIMAISGFYFFQSDFGNRFMAAVDPSGVSVTGEGMVVHRSRDGHFWLRAQLNGVPLRMLVDTGASNIVLSPTDAKAVGIRPDLLDFSSQAITANGPVKFARSTVTSFVIGDHTFFDVPVTVNGADMEGSLLGLTLLNQFGSVEFRGDTMILRP